MNGIQKWPSSDGRRISVVAVPSTLVSWFKPK